MAELRSLTAGSDSPIFFALRTTIAALLAMAVAQSFGLHHPWWATMTVVLVAQPTPGLLLERSLARLVGTICGAMAGALILDHMGGWPLLCLITLAVWLALCAGLGNLFRHFRNYGFVLAGYTGGRTKGVQNPALRRTTREPDSQDMTFP